MTAAVSQQVSLTPDQLQALAVRQGIHDFPTVLALRPFYSTIDQRDVALARATRELMSRNLLVNGDAQPDLVPMLQALHRPDRELAMRFVTPGGTARITAVRRGSLGVVARRVGDDVSLRTLGSVELLHVAAALVTELPKAKPADIQPVGAPLRTLSETLDGTHDPIALADRIRAMGTEPKAAVLLGTALAARQAFAEIVYYVLADEQDRISRSPGAVGVYYTKRGRIIAAPSVSPAGELWTTLKPGSDHAFSQAVGRLVELVDEEWGH